MDVREHFDQDRFAGHVGVEMVDAQPGRAVMRLMIRPEHLNGWGVVHGGVIFTLADMAFAAAATAHGLLAVALNASVTFVKPGLRGYLTAEARELSLTRRVGTYEVVIRNDADEVIATMQGLAYRKDAKIGVSGQDGQSVSGKEADDGGQG